MACWLACCARSPAAQSLTHSTWRLLVALALQAALQRVRIAVTVHVSLDTFTYSQPTIFRADGERRLC